MSKLAGTDVTVSPEGLLLADVDEVLLPEPDPLLLLLELLDDVTHSPAEHVWFELHEVVVQFPLEQLRAAPPSHVLPPVAVYVSLCMQLVSPGGTHHPA